MTLAPGRIGIEVHMEQTSTAPGLKMLTLVRKGDTLGHLRNTQAGESSEEAFAQYLGLFSFHRLTELLLPTICQTFFAMTRLLKSIVTIVALSSPLISCHPLSRSQSTQHPTVTALDTDVSFVGNLSNNVESFPQHSLWSRHEWAEPLRAPQTFLLSS